MELDRHAPLSWAEPAEHPTADRIAKLAIGVDIGLQHVLAEPLVFPIVGRELPTGRSNVGCPTAMTSCGANARPSDFDISPGVSSMVKRCRHDARRRAGARAQLRSILMEPAAMLAQFSQVDIGLATPDRAGLPAATQCVELTSTSRTSITVHGSSARLRRNCSRAALETTTPGLGASNARGCGRPRLSSFKARRASIGKDRRSARPQPRRANTQSTLDHGAQSWPAADEARSVYCGERARA